MDSRERQESRWGLSAGLMGMLAGDIARWNANAQQKSVLLAALSVSQERLNHKALVAPWATVPFLQSRAGIGTRDVFVKYFWQLDKEGVILIQERAGDSHQTWINLLSFPSYLAQLEPRKLQTLRLPPRLSTGEKASGNRGGGIRKSGGGDPENRMPGIRKSGGEASGFPDASASVLKLEEESLVVKSSDLDASFETPSQDAELLEPGSDQLSFPGFPPPTSNLSYLEQALEDVPNYALRILIERVLKKKALLGGSS